MSNHKVRTWNHRENKPSNSKLLPLYHLLDDFLGGGSSNHNLKKEKVMYVSVPKSHDNINTDH
jgi:hypothetical protein